MRKALARQAKGGGTPEEEIARENGGRPPLLDTCLAWSSASPVIARRWPHLYTGPRLEEEQAEPSLAQEA